MIFTFSPPLESVRLVKAGHFPATGLEVRSELGLRYSPERLDRLISATVSELEAGDECRLQLQAGAQYKIFLPEQLRFPLHVELAFREIQDATATAVLQDSSEYHFDVSVQPLGSVILDSPPEQQIVSASILVTTPEQYRPPENLVQLVFDIVRDKLVFEENRAPYPGYSQHIKDQIASFSERTFW